MDFLQCTNVSLLLHWGARCGLTIVEQRGRITHFGLQRRVARGLEECVPPWHPQLWHRQQTTLNSDQISRWVPLSLAAGSHPFAWAHHFIPLVLHGLGSDGADFYVPGWGQEHFLSDRSNELPSFPFASSCTYLNASILVVDTACFSAAVAV